ncbi:MAG: sulfite exporter TauE/SafE family protein [Pseudomonadota bacterium]
MQFYLPIAEMSVNILVIVGLGGLVGILSGMFGVGGGFLLTPLLIFYGVPPAVAVASQANQIAGSSIAGAIGHAKQGGLDTKMAAIMTLGGILGAALGTLLFSVLQAIGQLDVTIAISYVIFLGSVGTFMLAEGVSAMRSAARRKRKRKRKPARKRLMRRLPLQVYFPKSKLVITALAPLGVGALVGVLVAVLGVGGGFIMVPAMIYLLGMPTQVVVGTSLMQIIFVTAAVTIMHAVTTQSVDALLALLLLVGAVVGTRVGIQIGRRLKAEQLRVLLAIVVLGVGIKLAIDLVRTPSVPYTVETIR